MSNDIPRLNKEAESLRVEAKQILNRLLKIPEGYSNSMADRLIDCVIGSAMLETIDSFVEAKARQKAKQGEDADH